MMGALLAVFGSYAVLMYLSVSTFSTGQNQQESSFFRFQQIDSNSGTRSSWPPPRTEIDKATPSTGWSKTALPLGNPRRIGHIIATYRGKQGRSAFLLDVIIPDLDPQYTYRRQINIEEARKGFRVGAERFVLLSAGRSKIHLSHYVAAR